MNKNKLLNFMLFFLAFSVIVPYEKVNAATVQTPTISRIYQLNNDAKIEWSTVMTDVITSTSFEPGQETPNFVVAGNPKDGNQSLVSGVAYSDGGSRSIRLMNTENGTGNEWWYPSTFANSSIFNLPAKRIPNGKVLSINLKVKASSGTNAYITFSNNSPWGDRGTPFIDKKGDTIKYAQVVNYRTPPSQISITANGGVDLDDNTLFQLITSKGTIHDYQIFFYRWNKSLGKLVRDYNGSDIRSGDGWGNLYPLRYDTFNIGDPVLSNQWVYVGFNGRSVPVNDQWQTLTVNTMMNSNIYDFYNQGFIPQVHWRTDGQMYVDAIQFGYATLVNLYRDGTNVYNGYLSDFEDTGATDKVSPDSISNLINTYSSGVSNLSWNPSTDYGTGYNYTIQGVSESGTSATSGNYRLTVTSGIKHYAIIVDNNPNTIVSTGNFTATTTSTSYSVPTSQGGYFHVASVDNAGNISSTITLNIDKIAPSNPIISTSPVMAPAPFNWTKNNAAVNIQSGIDTQSGVARTEYSIDLGNTWNTYTTPVILSTEKAYTIMARTIDNGGNYSGISQTKFGIDRTYPNATATISQNTYSIYSATVTNRNVVINLSNINDNASGQYTVRLANKSDFSDATGYIDIQGLSSKQINFTLDQRTPYTANYTDRIVYVEIKDIAGNTQILQATTKLEPFAPSMPVITNPLDNTVRLIKEGTMIEWKYSDINNDPSPLAQAKSELFIYKGADLVKDFMLNGTASSVYINDLPYGEYNVKVTVWNSLGKSATSNPSKLRINKFLNEGSLITKAFETSSPMKYVEVLTTSEIPFGTELYANIYIADKDGNYDSSKPIKTEIHNVRDNKNLIKLPRPTSYLRVEYKLYNKASPANDAITPLIDNVTVLAK